MFTQEVQNKIQELEHLLVMHKDIEEEFFYIPLKERLGRMSIIIDLSEDEHKITKKIIANMLNVEHYQSLWSALYNSLRTHLENHMAKEESEIFPIAKQYLSDLEAKELCSRMKTAEESYGTIMSKKL